MATLMEDLPIEVQTELRDTREQMAHTEGWDFGTHATVPQWRAYYSRLGPRAQEFLVEHMLELASTGSLCVQADHQNSLDASWGQLREVVKLHNARVTEAEMLRRRLDFLEGRAPSGPTSQEIAAEIEKVLNPPITVQMPEPEFLPVDFGDGAAPADRVLYVVKDPPGGEDGG